MAKEAETKTQPKIQTKYSVDFRNIKYPRLEFKTGTLLLVLPKTGEDEKEILKKHRKWILEKELYIKKALEKSKEKKLNQIRTVDEFKKIIDEVAIEYQKELMTRINAIFFKEMKTKWASYSQKGNLTINTLMNYLPDELIEYILFHEVCHSLERKHNRSFWSIVGRKFTNFSEKEEELFIYWFAVQQNLH